MTIYLATERVARLTREIAQARRRRDTESIAAWAKVSAEIVRLEAELESARKVEREQEST